MAGPTQETKATLSFKKLVGKAHTSNSTPFYSESIPSQISIDSSEILGDSIPTDPQTAVNDGVGEYVELDLQEIAASNGLAFNLRFPSDYSGDFGTSVQGDLVRTHTQVVDQKNNRDDGIADPSHTGGYVYDLEDGTGTQIPEGASENWQLDPVGGIIVSEQEITELTSNGGTVGCYIFTGNTLEESLTNVQSDNVTVEDDNTQVTSDLNTLDFGVLTDVTDNGGGDVTVDVNDDLSQYDNSTSDFANASLFVDGFKTDFVDTPESTASYQIQDATSLNTLDTGPELTASTADVAQANEDIAFNGDGTKLFVLNAENIAVYNLSTPYDISSGSVSFANQYFNDTGSSGTPLVGSRGLTFNNDGTRLFIVEDELGNGTTQQVSQYDLGTAYDISNASLVSNGSADGTFDLNAATAFSSAGRVEAILFNDTGTKIYVPESGVGDIKSFSLGTAFDVTTADGSTAVSTLSTGDDVFALAWNNDGTALFSVGFNTVEYSLTSAYDLSTASATGDTFSNPTASTGIIFDDVGSKVFYTKQDTASDGTGSVESFNGLQTTTPRSLTYDFTGLTVSDNTTEVSTTVTDLNLGTDLDVTDDGSGQVTVNSTLSSKTTDDLSEGSTNLYFTDERAQDAVDALLTGGTNITLTYDDANDNLTIDAATSLSVDDSTTNVATGVDSLNFGSDLGVTDDGGGAVTIDVPATLSGVTGVDASSFTIDADGTNPLSLVNNGSGELQLTDGSSNFQDFRVRDLTVEGSETILNTETVSVADNTVVLNSDVTGSPTENGGIEINRGSETNATLLWNETGDYWMAGTQGNEVELANVNEDLSTFNNDAGFISDLSTFTTDDLSEGSNNLYYTDARVKNDFQAGGDINYTKSTLEGFALTAATLNSGESLDVSGTSTATQGVSFNDDGTKAYVTDSGQSLIFEYNLSTPYDISTGTSSGNSLDVSGNVGSPEGIAFNGDGTKVFVAGAGGNLYEYSLGVGFDFGSTATFTTSDNLGGNVGTARAVSFNSDGTTMIVADSGGDDVDEFTLGTGFDLSSGVTYQTSLDVSTETGAGSGLAFNGDGTEMFLSDPLSNIIYKYTLTSGFDLSTASFANESLDVSSTVSGARGLTFNSDGSKMFVADNSSNTIYEYNSGSGTGLAEFSLDVSSLSASDLFGSKTTDDLPEGSSNLYYTRERTEDDVNALLTGGTNVTLTYTDNAGSAGDLTIDAATNIDVDDSGVDVNTGIDNLNFGSDLSVTDNGSGAVTIDSTAASTASVSVSDDGTTTVSGVEDINFASGITVTDDGDSTVTVDNDVEFGSATFSGDGSQTQFNIAHGLSSTPSSFVISATTDDASGPSHVNADSTNLTVTYDSAPPTGTNNVELNYALQV